MIFERVNQNRSSGSLASEFVRAMILIYFKYQINEFFFFSFFI